MFSLNLVTDFNGNISSRKLSSLKKNNSHAYLDLIGRTSFLPDDCELIERVFCFKNKLTSRPVCLECGAKVNYSKSRKTYSRFCSAKCSANSKSTRNKFEETCLEKYQVSNPNKTNEVKSRRKKTVQRIYSVDNISQAKAVKEMKKTTCRSNFGVDFPMQSVLVRKKSAETLKERYNVSNIMEISEIREKASIRARKSMLERYGVNNPSYINLDKKITKFLLNKPKLKKWLIIQHHTLRRTHKQIARILNIAPSSVDSYCKQFNIETRYYSPISNTHSEVLEYVKKLTKKPVYVNYRGLNDLTELDIYIPCLKIGIEVNGIYWHSEGLNDIPNPNRHLKKTEACLKQGITLLHITETEWLDPIKQSIWKSKLDLLLGQPLEVIYARNCEVKLISSRACSEFLKLNHLQGSVNSKIKLGLFYRDRLYAVMTFSKSRFSVLEDCYEMLRFCSLVNTRVTGGASKLFKYFIRNYKFNKLVTYADRRYSQGNLYKALGFTHTHNTKPGFYYWLSSYNNYTLESRLSYQKHKLSKKLKIYDPQLTSHQNMFNNGYRRIWDCGHSHFVYSNS